VVGYGGRTINRLRLWAAAAPDYSGLQVFSHGQFVSAVAEVLKAESLTRVLYPDDSTSMGQTAQHEVRRARGGDETAQLSERLRAGRASVRGFNLSDEVMHRSPRPSVACRGPGTYHGLNCGKAIVCPNRTVVWGAMGASCR